MRCCVSCLDACCFCVGFVMVSIFLCGGRQASKEGEGAFKIDSLRPFLLSSPFKN